MFENLKKALVALYSMLTLASSVGSAVFKSSKALRGSINDVAASALASLRL